MTAGLVSLVGAGPGSAGLLTLRAVECLREADLILYDRLVPAHLLEHARPDAERVCVTELAERHAERCGPIHQTLIDAARRGRRVVRLKGGDPFVFGRGGEEAEALHAAGVPFEVVPGVTAALGAAACAGIPLTHRHASSAVAIVTGHENPAKGEPGVDWAALARFPGTLVIYMGLGRLEAIARTLIVEGKPADTPAAVVESCTTGSQRTVTAPLGEIAATVAAAAIAAPALTIIGDVVWLRSQLAWFEQRPLHGRRVLVTRPRGQAGPLLARLEQLGAVPLLLPTVEIRPPADWGPVDRAIAGLADYQWLVFTSVNGVHAFVGRLLELGRDLRALGGVRLAAIGPATAEALRGYHLVPDLVPATFRSEDLAAALVPQVAGQRVLLARADRGREALNQLLGAVARVEQVAVYSQVDAVAAEAGVLDALRRGEVDFVLLTSSNIVRALARLLDDPCQARLREGRPGVVSISPVTSAAVLELGWPVAAEAKVFTVPGVIEALLQAACGSRPVNTTPPTRSVSEG
jgi:uroporphyrinogen III methyltransferase/synthase